MEIFSKAKKSLTDLVIIYGYILNKQSIQNLKICSWRVGMIIWLYMVIYAIIKVNEK